MPQTPRLIVVTGLSGSGKSIALNVLEDTGYFCIDNLPVSLLERFTYSLVNEASGYYERSAVGIDVRNQSNDLSRIPPLVERVRQQGVRCDILFLDADTEVLIRRFSETRRRHPLSNQQGALENAIRLERELLEPLLSQADLRIDTSRTTLHELRRLVQERVAERRGGELSILIQSFGFKHGLPRNADFVFDARCLPNPHWHPQLRPYTGQDPPVCDFLEGQESVARMLGRIEDFIIEWLPCFEHEGRAYLTLAIGCTGGQHRSVYLAEQLNRCLLRLGHKTTLSHRELA